MSDEQIVVRIKRRDRTMVFPVNELKEILEGAGYKVKLT